MAEVFAGFVAGYILALLTTLPFAILLFRLRGSSEVLARIVPTGTAVGFSVVLHGALFFCWTLVGLLFGLVLLAMNDAGAGRGLGSANFAFTLFVAAVTLMLVAPFAVIMAGARRYLVAGALSVVLVFGWLMPWLAEWSSFNK